MQKPKENKIINYLTSIIGNFFFQEYFRSSVAIWLSVLSVTANLTNWIILKMFIHPIDLPIILHYNVYFGVDMMGNYRQVYWLPFLGIILFIINFFLSIYLYKKKERIASYLLMMAVLMIQLSLIIASISIIIINY